MQFVPEKIIDQIIDDLDNTQVEEYLKELLADQEEYVRFISTENFKLLTEEEYDVLIFMSITIWKAIKETNSNIASISGDLLSAMDEKNWAIYNEEKHFSKAIDIFFEDYPQEDLLAFVEDSLQQDDDSNLSQVGREIIFLSCKSLIDAAHFVNEELD